MKLTLLNPITGIQYNLTCPSELASALAAGHILVPKPDPSTEASRQQADEALEAAAEQLEALRELERYAALSKEEQDIEFEEWKAGHENLTREIYRHESDYSSPEYLGTPEFDDEELAPAEEIPFDIKVWTRDQIKALLKRNDQAVNRAMVALSKRDDLPPWQAGEISNYAHWVEVQGKSLTGRFLKKARTLALRNSHKLEEIANAR